MHRRCLLSLVTVLLAVHCGSSDGLSVFETSGGDLVGSDVQEPDDDRVSPGDARPESDDPAGTEVNDADAGDALPDADVLDGSDEVDADAAVVPSLTCLLTTAAGDSADDVLSLTLSDEPLTYAATPGLQVDVLAVTEGVEAGQVATLSVGGTDVATQPVALGEATGSLQALFANVTLPPGTDLPLVVRVASAPGGPELSCAKTLTVGLDACSVLLTPLPSGDGCVLADADVPQAGFQMAFTVSAPSGGCTVARLSVAVGGGEPQLTEPVALGDLGTAMVLVTVSDQAVGLNGLRVDVAGRVEQPERPALTGTTDATTWYVDTDDPVVTLTGPVAGALGLGDDVDGEPANGLQLDVTGEVTGLNPGMPGDVLRLTSSSGLSVAQGDPPSPFLFDDVGFTLDGVDVLTVTATDACGRTGQAQVALELYTRRPHLELVAPAEGAVLLARDDGDPLTPAYEADVVVQVGDLPAGRSVIVRCRPAGTEGADVEVGRVLRADVVEAFEAVPVALDLAVLTSAVSCLATHDYPNASESEPRTFTLALPAPAVQLTAPVEGLETRRTTLVVQGTAEHLEGRPLAATIRAASDGEVMVVSQGFATVSDGAFSGTLDVSTLSDGAYVVVVDGADVFGNLLSDLPDGSPTRAFTVDRTAPEVVLWQPVTPLFDEAVSPDLDPDVPGYQRALTVHVHDANGAGGVQVCLALNGGTATCYGAVPTLPMDGSGLVTFAGLTFLPGDNAVEIVATDAAGNATSVAWNVVLVSDRARLEMLQPAHDVVVAIASQVVVVRLSDAGSGAAIAGADVVLQRDGVDVGPMEDDAAGVYTLGVDLGAGANRLQARATVGGVDTYSEVRTVTWKMAAPVVALVDPAEGAVIDADDPTCASAASDCVRDVRATTTDVEDGSMATLSVLCGASLSIYPATVMGGALAFPDVVLTDQATCLLAVDVVDAAGTHATAAPISVRVDRVRPRLLDLELAPYVLAKDDADGAEPGLQRDVPVVVAGLEAGSELTLTVRGEAATTTLHVPNPEAVADTDSASRTFRVTFPAGAVTLTLDASDQAGNAALSLARSTWVVDTLPAIRLTGPEPFEGTPCSQSAPCTKGLCIAGACHLPWGLADARQVSIAAEGLVVAPSVATNVRACSSGAPAGSPACATAGYRVVASGRFEGAAFDVPLPGLPDGRHQLIVEGLADPLLDLWVASLDAGTPADGRYRRVYQDTVAPSVTGATVLSDTLAPANVLNLAERSPEGRFQVQVTASEVGTAALLVNGVAVATADALSGVATFDAALPEGPASLQARLTDLVGNVGEAGPVPALDVHVDTIAPALAFVFPDRAVLTAADPVDAVLESDAPGVAVELFDGVTSLGLAATGADLRATFVGALAAAGTHVLRGVGTDPAGNATEAAPEPASVLVDRTPPSVAVTSPADLAVLSDADGATPGFQVVVAAATDGAVTWRVLVARGCTAEWSACSSPALLAEGAVANPGGPEPPLTLTLPGASSAHYVLTFEAKDEHGNATAVPRRVSLDVAGCVVTLHDFPPSGFLNNARCPTPGVDCASVGVSWVASYVGACPGITALRLSEDGAAVSSQLPVDGRATFPLRTYADGRAVVLEVKALAGTTTVGTSGPRTLVVDLADPQVAFVATSLGDFTTPASGASVAYGVVDDHDGGTSDLQIPVVVRVTDAHAAGGTLERFEAWRGASMAPLAVQSPALPATLGASPATVTAQGLTLSDGALTVKAFAIDSAGNEASTQFEAVVDQVPPAAVTLQALEDDEIDRRLPRVLLRWTAPGDDGDVGLAVAYDVRFSRDPITDDASFELACPVTDVTSFDAAPVPAAPGQAEQLEVRGPDVRPSPSDDDPARCKLVVGGGDVTYNFAVRAQDDVGNASPISAAQVASTSALNVKTARIAFSGSLQDDQLNRLFTPLGDVNGDGLSDFTSYSTTLKKACVVLGRNDGSAAQEVPEVQVATDVSPTHRCFDADPGTTYVGVYAAGLGDLDGDGIGDWAMGYGSTPERVDVFLGVATSSSPDQPPIAASPFLRVRGQSYATPATASQVFRVGDFDGDGLADLGVGSRVTNVFYLLLFDRTFTGGATPRWVAGDAPIELSVTTPSTYGAVRVVRVNLTGWTDPQTWFGMNAAGVGNLLSEAGEDATPPQEVAIYQQNTPNQVFVLKGRAVPTSPVDLYLSAAHNGTATNNLEVVRLVRESTAVEGLFGIDLSGGVDLDGRGAPDLVIGHYLQAQKHTDLPYGVYVFYGEALQGELGVRLSGVKLGSPATTVGEGVLVGQYGVIVPGPYRRPAIAGDFDGAPDGRADLVMHDLSSTTWGAFWLRLNGADVAASIPRGSFPYVDLTVTSPYPGEPSQAFASAVFPLSDFNGDGFPDILVGVKGGGFPTVVY